MSIVRISKDDNYSVIANQPINDSGLSWGARGMLAYLLSKPNDWEVSMVDLERKSPAGAHATRTLVRELEKAGYMVRERQRTEGGKFIWITTVYETIPQLSIDGLSIDGKVPDILNTDLQNTELKGRKDENQSLRKRKRVSKPVDERIKHPAIVGYRELVHLNVPIAWREDVVKTIGDDPEKIQKWLELIKEWLGHTTWNKGNLSGMLDAYRNGGLKNGKSQSYAEQNQRIPKGI